MWGTPAPTLLSSSLGIRVTVMHGGEEGLHTCWQAHRGRGVVPGSRQPPSCKGVSPLPRTDALSPSEGAAQGPGEPRSRRSTPLAQVGAGLGD